MPERPAKPVEVPEEPALAVSWLEQATEHVGVRAVYLSLAGHLVLAILLTLWATRLPEPPQRLAPLVLDFGPADAEDFGETLGDDAQATVIAAAKQDEKAADAPADDRAEDTPPAENPEAMADDGPAEPTRLPPAVQPAAMKVAGAKPPGIGEPQSLTEPGPPGGQAAAATGGGRASAADAKQAIGKRSGAARGEAAIARGGSPASEIAVERGLLWLARHQAADGSWSFMQPHCIDTFGNPGQRCECRGKGYIEGRTKASTAIALLPFLGAGNTHIDGPYKEVVYRGIEQLKASLDIELQELHPDAPEFVPTFVGDLYGYGITALVFAEAFSMTGDPDLERYVAALANFLTKHQHPLGGWRYEPGQPGDMTVTGWQVIALKSSQIAGAPIHSDVFRDVDRFLTSLAPPTPVARGQARLATEPGPEQERDLTRYHYLASYANSTTREPNECTSAIGLLCRLYTGWQRNDPRLLAGVDQLLKSRAHPALQLYRNFYLAQLLLQADHPAWPHWNRRNRDYLVMMQASEASLTDPRHPAFGGKACEIGSWYLVNPRGTTKEMARDRHIAPAGRLAHTALAILTLEVYYRLLPIYKADAVE
jgi:hypothetical protein